MRPSLGWQTDLAVLRLRGSQIRDRGDHLVVRTPANPDFYWGNFVLALDGPGDADRWLGVFEDALPEAKHRAVGLVASPEAEDEAWAGLGFDVEHDDVLVGPRPDPRPLPAGYVVRPLAGDADWAASTALRVTANPDEVEYERGETKARQAMVATGSCAWFGAFAEDGSLASELGIVDIGDGVARYQSVLTGAGHRRRGLTGHLLGVAAAWASERGSARMVIVAEARGDADRLYRSVGFRPADRGWRAIRRPRG